MIIKKKYHFVYVTINLVDGKKYIGDHSTNKLEDGYLGSGIRISNAIKKYGKENFKRKILEFFDNKEEAFKSQYKWINEYNSLSPNGYNISPKGGHYMTGSVSEETKKKMSELKIGKKRIPFTEEHKKNIKESSIGKIIKDSTRLKISKANKGNQSHKGYMHSEESRDKIKLSISGKNNPMFGKSLKEVWIEKYGEANAEKKFNEWKENHRHSIIKNI